VIEVKFSEITLMERTLLLECLSVFQTLPRTNKGAELCLPYCFLPEDILKLCLQFCGGKDQLPLVCSDSSLTVPSVVFHNTWVTEQSRNFEHFRKQFDYLLNRRFCLVICRCSNGSVFYVQGWLSVFVNGLTGELEFDVLTKDEPFELRQHNMTFEILASDQGYCFGHVLNDPLMVSNLVKLAFPYFNDLKNMIVQNVWDKISPCEVPRWISEMIRAFSWNLPVYENQNAPPVSLLKEHSVGKFWRRRHHSRLKKKKNGKRGDKRKKRTSIKKINHKRSRIRERKGNRVHKRNRNFYTI